MDCKKYDFKVKIRRDNFGSFDLNKGEDISVCSGLLCLKNFVYFQITVNEANSCTLYSCVAGDKDVEQSLF